MGSGFCSLHSCGDIDEQQFSTMEPRRKRPESVDYESLSKQPFVEVSKSDRDRSVEDMTYSNEPIEANEDNKYEEDDDESIPYATAADFVTVDDDDDNNNNNNNNNINNNNNDIIAPPTSLYAISESRSISTEKLKTSSTASPLKALRMKYSSRRVILPEKDKERTPQCFDCGGFYHIQSDPISAYDGVGIVCGLCGMNRTDHPKLLLEDHYYHCEQCENVDICCECYQTEKRKLIKNKNSSKK